MKDILINGHETYAGHVFFRPSLDDLPGLLGKEGPVFIIYDRNAGAHAGKIASLMPAVSEMAIDVSEDSKTLSSVACICDWLLGCGADRNAVLLAVGGGILTDMAGFAAAIYKRGIKAAYVPTTLLAQVDASVGGKTGVNFYGYKNMLGVIRQPVFTYICPEVLTTLPYSHILEGVSEMVKTFIIEDNGNYRKAVGLFSGIWSSPDRENALISCSDSVVGLVYESVKVKSGIVSMDPFERGERKKLNLGHTFAHAIEWCDHSISHGRAVSAGMVCAARLSEKEGLCRPGLSARLAEDLAACGLDTDLPFPADMLRPAMVKDKKAENGKIGFVLIRDIGNVEIVPLSADTVIETLNACC